MAAEMADQMGLIVKSCSNRSLDRRCAIEQQAAGMVQAGAQHMAARRQTGGGARCCE